MSSSARATARARSWPWAAAPATDTIYPVSELAQRHGAGVSRETSDPNQAYGDLADDVETPYQPGWLPDL